MEIEKEVKEELEGIVDKVTRRLEDIASLKMVRETEEMKTDIDYRDSETITINAPKDYYKRYKICDPLKGDNMISFKDKDKYLREENLSLREVTLRMIPVLTIVDKKNDEYKEILHYVEKYIKTHCKHEIIQDLIDIDPDRSKTIFYCKHCETTFNDYSETQAYIVHVPIASAEICENT